MFEKLFFRQTVDGKKNVRKIIYEHPPPQQDEGGRPILMVKITGPDVVTSTVVDSILFD